MTDETAQALIAAIDALREELARHRPTVVQTMAPNGCVCPLGAERGCGNWNCPRRSITAQPYVSYTTGDMIPPRVWNVC